MPDAQAFPLHDTTDATDRARLRLRVKGRVQGVGFRPTTWHLARSLGLSGFVLNDSEGVLIEVEGAPDTVAAFPDRLQATCPPLARIDRLDAVPCRPLGRPAAFEIRHGAAGEAVTATIGPDGAICDDCLAELLDPADRRYRYPFLNCTQCGPRFTITARLPYDRAQTSMSAFPLCRTCAAEYTDPADRRFHAQPTACPDCGPRLSAPVEVGVAALRAGEIVALKGLGGFHLACEARNAEALARLRARKQREGKPFAVMVPSLAAARRLAEIGPTEATLLSGRDRPIVLCRQRADADLPADLTDGLPTIGLMLPYTPLQVLLFHEAAGRPAGTAWLENAPPDWPLVMTSANPGGDPLVIDDAEAERRLGGIADRIIGHDRAILRRADDSVVRVIDGKPAWLRRSRGQVPVPIRLPSTGPSVLALGAHLCAAACATRGDEAVMTPHIGDLDTPATIAFLAEAIEHLCHLLDVRPVAVAHDRHPDFASTRLAEQLGLPTIPVQHHHAHLAAVAAEHRVIGPALGLALDGYGLGDGGAAWGGELMRIDGPRYKRIAGLAPLPQPGGDKAARQPWRMAAAVLAALGRGDEIEHRFADQPEAEAVATLLARGIACPPTSSCGRMFDAVCGLAGLVPRASYEAQAPMHLEALVRKPRVLDDRWSMDDRGDLALLPLLAALADEPDRQRAAELFHGTLAAWLVGWVAHHHPGGGSPVLLAGGCLANRVLAEALVAGLGDRGLTALLPRAVPAGDGGLALGQAWVARQTIDQGDLPCA